MRDHLPLAMIERDSWIVAGTDIMTGHLFTNGELIATRSAGTRDRCMKRAPAVTHLQIHTHPRRGLSVWRGAQQALFRELHTPAGAYDGWVGDRAG